MICIFQLIVNFQRNENTIDWRSSSINNSSKIESTVLNVTQFDPSISLSVHSNHKCFGEQTLADVTSSGHTSQAYYRNYKCFEFHRVSNKRSVEVIERKDPQYLIRGLTLTNVSGVNEIVGVLHYSESPIGSQNYTFLYQTNHSIVYCSSKTRIFSSEVSPKCLAIH